MNAFAYINPNAADDARAEACAAAFAQILTGPSPIRNKRDKLLAETRDAQDEFRAERPMVADDAFACTSRLANALLAFEQACKAEFAKLDALDNLTERHDMLECVQDNVSDCLPPELARVFAAYVAEAR